MVAFKSYSTVDAGYIMKTSICITGITVNDAVNKAIQEILGYYLYEFCHEFPCTKSK